MTCLYAFEIIETQLVSFYACDESLSVGTPDLSIDWLVEPVTITDNLDDGFDALFEVVDPETSQVLGGEFEMDALETETERFDLIGENAAGFLKLTTTGVITTTDTSWVHIVRLSKYEQLANDD